MSTEQLKQSLKNLHEHLSGTDQVDAELSELLSVLNDDIHQLLNKERPDQDALSHLGDRTLALSAKLAAQSPHLESGLRELGNILLRMGV
jgi:predicted component of type VI protein secretion system